MANTTPICSRRQAIKIIAGGVTLSQVLTASESSPVLPAARPRETTMLFFDDEPLYAISGLARRLGQPRRVASYHETAGNCTWGRPAVFRNPDGRWLMVYQAGVGRPNRGGGVILLAESEDGLNWRPRDTTGSLAIENRAAVHQIIPATAGSYCSVIEDAHADPAMRFKLLAVRETETTSLWTSPDLLRWAVNPGVKWHPYPPDPPAFGGWNEVEGCFTITTRPSWPDRRVCLVTTRDWKTFTEPKLAMHADADDRPLAQLYGMKVVPYAGYYLGLLWVFYAGDASPASSPVRYRGGRVETYLAYSLNGVHWHRCFHQPLFRNGSGGDPDAGCLQISHLMPLDDGSLRAYGACSTSEHGICPPDDGHIVAYGLRRDGLVYLEAAGTEGVASTRALYWRDGHGRINVDAAGGTVTAAVLDARGRPVDGYNHGDCDPCDEDTIAWVPRWRGGKSLSDLAGRMIRFELRLKRARLYSIRGAFSIATLLDFQRWEESRLAPPWRPGF